MRALMPDAGQMTLRKEMDRLFDRLWDGEDMPTVGAWAPKLDLSETKDNLCIRAEVPGIEAKDIRLTLQNGVLTLQGEKRQEIEEKDERFYRTERVYGSFARSLRLPANVDTTKVSATFKNGVLMVVLPKAAEARGTAIPIKVG
jgi:HSP20 family protein